jgi:hypothetical protein
MKFTEFVQEAKLFKLTSKEYTTVQAITKKYIDLVQTKTESELFQASTKLSRKTYSRLYFNPKERDLALRYIHLGTYTVEERKNKKEKPIDVYVITNAPTNTNEGLYDSNTEEIFLFHDLIQNFTKQEIISVVTHEIIHAVQHYKSTSKEYEIAVKNPEPTTEYYFEPIEFEATLSGVVNSLYNTSAEYLKLIKKYTKLQDFNVAKLYTQKHEEFLKSILRFIETPVQSFDKLDIPNPIRAKLEFFKQLNNDKSKSKKYRTILFKAVEKMKKDLQFVNAGLKK